ncbi:MAG TPA: hypothetical protein PLW65_21410 [Pseudomonadota bacterium]|nr:hypothetical protein [Pseudomonadota bacterium]
MPSFDRPAASSLPAAKVALVAMGVLLWSLPAAAQSREVCSRTGHLLVSMVFAAEGNLEEDSSRVSAAVKEPPGRYVDSCVQLQEQAIFQNPQYQRKGQWFGFTPPEYRTVPTDPAHLQALYDGCRASSCSMDEGFLSLLQKVCREQLGRSGKACDDELNKKRIIKPLPVWRKGVGGALIGVGGLAIVLGSIHLGVPLFRTAGGCIEYGLEHPCVADRFGAGGALLGVGLAAVGGGVLALTLP